MHLTKTLVMYMMGKGNVLVCLLLWYARRLINSQSLMLGQEPRQTTSNLGHLNKPSIQALIHGLNRFVTLLTYAIPVAWPPFSLLIS